MAARVPVLWLCAALAACSGTPPPDESDPPPSRGSREAAPHERPARRNAGVLAPGPLDGGVYGGITGEPDTEPIPGLPPLGPRGPCEDAVAHVRQLLCSEKIERGDGPAMTEVRDVVIESCAGATPAPARRCVAAATSVAALRRCPRAARPRSPRDCEAIRLHILKLSLVDQDCPSDASRMSKEREGYLIEAAAHWVKADGWKAKCEKAEIPRTVFRCATQSATSDELARCGL